MIAMQAVQAPPGFVHAGVLSTVWTVIELEAESEREVRVTVSGVGYRDGPDYAAVYEFFRRGNAWTPQQLRRRFVEGPIDWSLALGKGH